MPWGVQYCGGYHEYSGVILSTVGDTQYHGGYHDVRGGYHEYRGGVQYRGDTILCNLSTVGIS